LIKSEAVEVVEAALVATVFPVLRDLLVKKDLSVQLVSKDLRAIQARWVQKVQSVLRANKVFRAFRASKV
jgi:ABC-type antimicrobial peptide transport system ATPase subunit